MRRSVGRAAGLILLMAGFAASSVAFVQHARSGDLPGHVDRAAERHAAVKAATLELETATQTLEQAHRLMDSYADADLRIFRELTIVRADETGSP